MTVMMSQLPRLLCLNRGGVSDLIDVDWILNDWIQYEQ